MNPSFRTAPPDRYAFCRRPGTSRPHGFTLLELMIVLGIAAILMTMTIPFVGGILNDRPVVKTTNDILDVLSQARAQAILKGKPAVVRIFPRQGVFKALPAGVYVEKADPAALEATAALTPSLPEDPAAVSHSDLDSGNAVATAVLPEDIVLEMVDINFVSRKDDELAEAFFYPNGTCDALTIVFQRGSDQWRLIRVDILTGMAEFETDPKKFMSEYSL